MAGPSQAAGQGAAAAATNEQARRRQSRNLGHHIIGAVEAGWGRMEAGWGRTGAGGGRSGAGSDEEARDDLGSWTERGASKVG